MFPEQYETHTSWRNSMLMFVAGTAVGAVAALMMAPASGREAREYLRRQGKRVADDVGAQADRLASAVKWGRDQASTAVDSAVSQAKSAYSSVKTRLGEEATHGMEPALSQSSQPGPTPTRSPRPTSSLS